MSLLKMAAGQRLLLQRKMQTIMHATRTATLTGSAAWQSFLAQKCDQEQK